MHRCPREEEKLLKPEGIYEVECSGCGEAVEFFSDDQMQKCNKCGLVLANPRGAGRRMSWLKECERRADYGAMSRTRPEILEA